MLTTSVSAEVGRSRWAMERVRSGLARGLDGRHWRAVVGPVFADTELEITKNFLTGSSRVQMRRPVGAGGLKRWLVPTQAVRRA